MKANESSKNERIIIEISIKQNASSMTNARLQFKIFLDMEIIEEKKYKR